MGRGGRNAACPAGGRSRGHVHVWVRGGRVSLCAGPGGMPTAAANHGDGERRWGNSRSPHRGVPPVVLGDHSPAAAGAQVRHR